MPNDLVPVSQAAQKQVERAQLTIQPVSGPSKVFVFPLNPYQLRVRKRAGWRNHISPDDVGAGTTEWAGTAPRTIELDVVLDASERDEGNVLPLAEDLLRCCQPPDDARGKTAAPKVRFSWGKVIQLDAVMVDVAITFTEFWPSGVPFRADASLVLRELTIQPGPQNPTSGSVGGGRVHEVVAGDSLASIAQAEYGHPGRWRDIAELNRVDDPGRLAVGTTLLLPPKRALGTGHRGRGREGNGHA